jgi:hypothetical protein
MKYSNSYIQQFKDCPLSSHFKYDLGLQKIEDEASEHHLVYGKAFHEALACLYQGGGLEQATRLFKEGYPKQLDPEDSAKTQANGIVALQGYVKKYLREDLGRWEILSVEEKDAFEYGQEDPFTVVLDLVARNKEHGGIYGWDHKVVGGRRAYLSNDFWFQFEPNSQVTKYYSYVEKKYGECHGFYINAVGIGHRSRAYKGEPAGPWARFGRRMFNRNANQLEMERLDTTFWIEQIERAREKGYYGMNTSSCRFCTFRPICSAGWTWEEDKELILIQYEQNASQIKKEVTQ